MKELSAPEIEGEEIMWEVRKFPSARLVFQRSGLRTSYVLGKSKNKGQRLKARVGSRE